MASAVITFTAGSNAGASLRQLASQIQKAAAGVGDTNGSGASVTCTINDTPGSGALASVVIAGGGLPTQTTYLV